MVERLFSIKKTMEVLSISRTSLYRLIDSGSLKPLKIGGKVLFAESELDAFIKRLKKERDNKDKE